MIVQSIINTDNRLFIITKSDKGYQIRKVGTEEIYGEACDLYPTSFTYEEIIPEEEEEIIPEDEIIDDNQE